MTIESNRKYLERNSFREGGGVSLALTADQEKSFEACMKGNHGGYNAVGNNCGDPVEKCLKGVGLSVGGTISPGALGLSLLKSGHVIYGQRYPATQPRGP
jgi:hypothetical protein